ncbi:ATP-dependent protease ClpP protease subunit [Flavobacterium aquaticum]|uniref:ATP-dependent protease ClpP protease subunit n=1 Tax=Flavobacterium aquaticum TaxID=1236486 RepID=A0A327YMB1_9FLAO|nr:Clp protease ClpP [Flavobacterium aquaticum]RAK21602.1 ATP-dependent protease ClpP protease subunit [Flavobacterium aquaticum]
MNIGKIYISGEIGVDCTLLDVIKQVKAQPNSDSFVVKIDSVGGFVDAGTDIYNYLRNLKKPITTITTKAYSIASVIFMAGDTRIIPEGAENAFMIHLPWMEAVGDTSALAYYLDELKTVENDLVKFYSKLLDIDSDTIHSLLRNETYLNATQALELGIATQLQKPQMAVAKLHNIEEKEEEGLMKKLNKKLDSIMNMLTGKIKAELILQDGTGMEIIFPELSEGDMPEVGEKATVDGKEANGEFLMPDGSTMVFEKGLLTEIKPEESDASEDDTAPLDAELSSILSEDGNSTYFFEGTMLTVGGAVYADAEKTFLPVGEYPLETNLILVVVEDGVVAELKEKEGDDTSESVEDLKAEIADLKAQLSELTSNEEVNTLLEVMQAMAEKTNEMESKYIALAKQIGSDFSTENKGNNPSIKAQNENLSRAYQILNSKF